MGVFKRVAKSKAVYLARKGARKVGQAIKKRYYNKKSGLKLATVVKDVMMLKKVINAEKKRINNTQNFFLAQLNGSVAGGLQCIDITPIPTQGSGYSNRTGSSIKMCSLHVQAQVRQQSATQSPIKYKFMIIQVLGTPQSTSVFPYQMYDMNTFVGGGGVIVDYNSQLDPDYFGKYKILKTFRGSVKADPISGAGMLQTISFGMKFQHHIRFNDDTNTVSNGQLLLLCLADNGNYSTSTASTLTNVLNTAVSTGLNIGMSINHYYYDN